MASIKAISHHFPSTEFSNEEYFKLFPESESNENLLKIGVRNRYIVAPDETASDLAVAAGEKLFAEHGIAPDEVGFVLFCAQEFDHYTPSTACLIQERLGVPNSAGALDYNLGCSGFVYGLSLAKGLIDSTGVHSVLLLTSSTLTKTFHPRDKSSRFIFGDGAAATLITAGDDIGEFVFGTDGGRGKHIIVKDGGARNAITESSSVDNEDEFGNITSDEKFFMNGTGVFVFALKAVPKMVDELLKKSGEDIESIDHFIFHQANEFMIDTLRQKLGIPEHRFHVYMEHCGNTVSSTIPLVLEELIASGKAKKGEKVLLAAFGTGLSWAGTIIRV